MNVVIDVTPLQTEHRYRGIGTYVRELLPRLKIVDPTIETWGFDEPIESSRTVPDRSGGPVRTHPLAQWVSLAMVGSRSLGHHDLLHVTSYSAAPVRPPGPYVATVFDLIPLQFPQQYLSTWSDRLRYRWYLRHLTHAHHLFAISNAVRRECIEQLGIPAANISVTPLAPQPLPEPTDQHPMGGRPFAMVIGSPDPHKNVRFAIDALSRSRYAAEITLVMTGAHDATGLVEYASARSVELLHLGHVAPQTLSDLYAHALVCLFPSLYEGFGLPALEVLGVGGRLISSNRGALPEVVGDAAPVLPLEHEDWVEAIERSVTDEGPRDVDGARQHAESFSWERTARSSLEGYERLRGRIAR